MCAHRPENTGPPELFYDAVEAGKYTGGSRVQAVQAAMAARCLELLALPEDGPPALLLDVGCGSGLSGEVLAAAGHTWLGLDIAPAMLAAAGMRGSLGAGAPAGDALLADMGQGFGMRAGAFDGAVSVSALQWLCYAGRADHRAARRLRTFFAALYRCLRRGARAALQLYPETGEQLELISQAATAAGFGGGLVVDFPNSTKAKKYYLCLIAGGAQAGASLPRALGVSSSGGGGSGASVATGAVAGDDDVVRVYARRAPAAVAAALAGAGAGAGVGEAATFEARRERPKKKRRATAGGSRSSVKSREWILAKKDARRARGDETRKDSKYTGRKRRGFTV